MFKQFKIYIYLPFLYFSVAFLMQRGGISQGIFQNAFAQSPGLKLTLYTIFMTHLTITAMSLCFHRQHTHQGIRLAPALDAFFQIWLWIVTSMSKLDWVSVHAYHHAHSDRAKDPHSPIQKGIWHVLFLGVFDYSRAKNEPDVLKIRQRLPVNRLERLIENNLFDGPILLTALNMIFFGIFWGSIVSAINFLISPIFAVGGVNALAHWWGYRNHKTTDNSRNIGFLFPLNFLVCGELDHNNHHAKQKSCSFRHRWFEFDIGYFYIKVMHSLGWLSIKHVYTPRQLRLDFSTRVIAYLEKDHFLKERCEKLAQELNISFQQLLKEIQNYIETKRTDFEAPSFYRFQEFVNEVIQIQKAQIKFSYEKGLA